MKKLIPIILTAVISFTLTQNYIISSLEVKSLPGGGHVANVCGVWVEVD